MKAFTGTLGAYLSSIRGLPDAQLLMADCFTFTLASGAAFYFTNVDLPISYLGNLFLANSIRVQGLKYKGTVGLQVDSQTITIIAASTDSLGGGTPFLQAVSEGILDGAEIQRDRVFFSDVLGGTLVGGVTLFKGRVGEITELGRTTANVKVNSDLVLLDIDMPRNLWQPTCLHVLYDTGCTLVKSTFGAGGVVGATSTGLVINWTGADIKYQQGSITFTSGANDNITSTVKTVAQGASLTLIYPLQVAPVPGDTFTIYQGCDHTPATCKNKFNNQQNFRGFPFVPPPEESI